MEKVENTTWSLELNGGYRIVLSVLIVYSTSHKYGLPLLGEGELSNDHYGRKCYVLKFFIS